MNKLDDFCTASLVVLTFGMGAMFYKLCQIQLEVEHLAKNAKHYYGGPVRTRKEEKEYIKRQRKEENW